MFYYAYLNNERTCENVVESAAQITDSHYVEITQAQYQAREIIGLQYSDDTQTFATPLSWSGSTGDIQYRGTQTGLVKALDEIENELANHTHSDYANANHGHELSAITGLLNLLLTDTAGKQKVTITGDVLATIAGLSAGMHTCYSAGGSNATATNAPNTIESWRYLIHKNYPAYGWVMAFGSEGSVFTNYYDAGTWRGWKPIWDNNPSPLWSGTYYMNANQTIYPSKKLSECKNGWVLLWSNYTSASGATNGDIVATFIPKRCYDGSNWSGHSWLANVPTEASSNSETYCIKKLYVWNDRIVGNIINETSPRNNAVLRGVYEF